MATTDEEGVRTEYFQNDRGQMTSTTMAAGSVDAAAFQFDFDDRGNQTKFRNPALREREKRYTADGRLEWELGPVCDSTTASAVGVNRRTAVKYSDSGSDVFFCAEL